MIMAFYQDNYNFITVIIALSQLKGRGEEFNGILLFESLF